MSGRRNAILSSVIINSSFNTPKKKIIGTSRICTAPAPSQSQSFLPVRATTSVPNSHNNRLLGSGRCCLHLGSIFGVTKPKTYAIRKRGVFLSTPETLYGIIADISSYQNYIPWCVSSKIISNNSSIADTFMNIAPCAADTKKEVMLADLTIEFGPFEAKYTSVVELDPFDKVVAKVVPTENSPLSELLAIWKFSRCGEDAHRRDGVLLYNSRHAESGTGDLQLLPSLGSQLLAEKENKGFTEVTFYTRFSFKNPLYSKTFDVTGADTYVCDRIFDSFRSRVAEVNAQ